MLFKVMSLISESNYIIHSYYYSSFMCEHSSISIIGMSKDYQEARDMAKEEANRSLHKIKFIQAVENTSMNRVLQLAIEWDYDKDYIDSINEQINNSWLNFSSEDFSILDQEDSILVGIKKFFDLMNYGGNSDIGDYCIIKIETQ